MNPSRASRRSPRRRAWASRPAATSARRPPGSASGAPRRSTRNQRSPCMPRGSVAVHFDAGTASGAEPRHAVQEHRRAVAHHDRRGVGRTGRAQQLDFDAQRVAGGQPERCLHAGQGDIGRSRSRQQAHRGLASRSRGMALASPISPSVTTMTGRPPAAAPASASRKSDCPPGSPLDQFAERGRVAERAGEPGRVRGAAAGRVHGDRIVEQDEWTACQFGAWRCRDRAGGAAVPQDRRRAPAPPSAPSRCRPGGRASSTTPPPRPVPRRARMAASELMKGYSVMGVEAGLPPSSSDSSERRRWKSPSALFGQRGSRLGLDRARIARDAVDAELVVQVRPGGESRHADPADLLALRHARARMNSRSRCCSGARSG